jgi:Mor family transcriptional regulator
MLIKKITCVVQPSKMSIGDLADVSLMIEYDDQAPAGILKTMSFKLLKDNPDIYFDIMKEALKDYLKEIELS